jgi:hypothetical protein
MDTIGKEAPAARSVTSEFKARIVALCQRGNQPAAR